MSMPISRALVEITPFILPLANARSMEIKALVDYNIAVANIAKVTGSTLEARNISLSEYIK